MKLRPYQEQGVADIRAAFQQSRRVLYVLSTGGGKTLLFSYISRGVYQNRKRVLILAHRRELLKQISSALGQWNVPHGILDAQARGIPRHPVVVGSVFTVYRRLKHMPRYDLIIQDEAHHCSGNNTYSKILNHFPDARQLGVTATPARASGEPLGASFDTLIEGPSTAELIAMGYLCPPEVYAPSKPNLAGVHIRQGDFVVSELDAAMNKPTITGDAIEHYRKLAFGKLTVVFCVSVKHARDTAEMFNKAGISAAHVDGKMEDFERDRTLARFSRGEIRVLTSCNLISEGFDVPGIECAIMLRPTESMPLYLQMVGRALRIYPGKSKAVILDAAGLTLRHGFPDAPREWTLAGEMKAPSERAPRVSVCAKCFAAYKPAPMCPRCGHIPPVQDRKVKHVDGELVQVSAADEYAAQTDDLARQYAILKNVGRNRGYQDPDGWAFGIISAKLAERLAKERGLPRGTVNGLHPDERSELRARVMKAMSNEDQPEML